MKLSPGEKLGLLLLCDISKRVGAESNFDVNFIEQTIYDDQLWGFDWQFTGIPYEREETPPLVSETVNILEMHSLCRDHFNDLPEDEQRKVKDALGYSAHGLEAFQGFDGNNDPHYGIAQYLVDHLKRFVYVPGAKNNSHSQTSLPRYKAMLRVYLPLRDKLGSGKLTPEQLVSIFSAHC